MKYLITGFSGFVSYHFLEYLNSIVADKNQVFGIDIVQPAFNTDDFHNLDITTSYINLLDYEALDKLILDFRPDRILHLAAFSSVAKSWEDPVGCFSNNTNIFLNLLEILHRSDIPCKLLSVGSSEEYGNVSSDDIPLKETHALAPVSPYAVARVSQELLSRVYADSFGMDIVLTRSFNHIGPRQRDTFVIPSFIKQICQAKLAGERSIILNTGNVDIIRDFLDVRDVVRAYFRLFEAGQPGIFYNVCSGAGHSLREIIVQLGKQMEMNIEIQVDPARIRPNDNVIIIGSNEKIFHDTAWQPQIPFEKSLQDIADYWTYILMGQAE